MKTQKRLDRVLGTACKRIQEEVSALMGVNFKLSEPFSKLISKEDYFDQITGKKVISKMDITGEIEDKGILVVDVRDAIRLGGTLIMLPPAELEEVVRSEEYTEETEDSYGEIANIIAGSCTKEFEDSYPQKCRFVRKEQILATPAKIDISSDEPMPNQWYYLVQCSMNLNDQSIGDLELMIPAEAFELEVPKDEPQGKPEEAIENQETETVTPEPLDTVINEEEAVEEKAEEITVEAARPAQEKKSSVDSKKQKKQIDKILKNCTSKISEEVGALLGVDVSLTTIKNRVIEKEEFFLEELSGKQILTYMDVVDDADSKSFLFVSVKDAIRIGSILIMLPPSELESAVSEEEFSADTEDAFGEIANIIAGVYTSVFQEQYTDSFRFIKKDLEKVSPMKVDCSSDEVIPLQQYYLNSCSLNIDGKEYGAISMLFPADLLKLNEIAEGDEEKAGSEEGAQSTKEETTEKIDKRASIEKVSNNVEVLILEDNRHEADKILGELQAQNLSVKCISLNDNMHPYITDNIKLVFIVMSEVNEQSFGVTIKVNTLTKAPIIAAGPEWTRSRVIKAVKYGVDDILLTPASGSDIKEKVDNNMVQMAA